MDQHFSKNGPKMFQKWSKMVQKWSKNSPKMVQKWLQNSPKMVQKWSKHCPDIVQQMSNDCPTIFQKMLNNIKKYSKMVHNSRFIPKIPLKMFKVLIQKHYWNQFWSLLLNLVSDFCAEHQNHYLLDTQKLNLCI